MIALVLTLSCLPLSLFAVSAEETNTVKRYSVLVLDVSDTASFIGEHGETIYTAPSAIEYVKQSANSFLMDLINAKGDNKYKEYINNAILKPLGKNAINDSRLDTKDTISYLMKKDYIIPGKTKLYYNRLNKTFIIKIDEKHKFWAGYYEGEYNDSREVNYIIKEYNVLHDAAAKIERKAGSKNSNPGIGPRYMKLLNSGVKDAEGMTIGDILDSINNSNI